MNQSNRIEEKLDIILDLLKRLPDKIEPIQKVIQRPTTDSQEREFEEEAKWPECDFGKTAKIVANYSDHCFFIGSIIQLVDPKTTVLANYDICGEGFDSYERIDSWGLFREDYELIPTRWKPEVRQMYWVAHSNMESVHPDIWEDKPQDWDWFNNDQVRKTESEALERSRELNRERVKAETSSPDSGKDGNIGKPSRPLRRVPKIGEVYCTVRFEREKSWVERRVWGGMIVECSAFQAGLCFPDTKAGRLGAELRAELGIQAPIDREELEGEQKLKEIKEALKKWDDSNWILMSNHAEFFHKLERILEGGSHA